MNRKAAVCGTLLSSVIFAGSLFAAGGMMGGGGGGGMMGGGGGGGGGMMSGLTGIERLGMMIYRDTNLSRNKTQSCMTCHHPMAGFADPDNMLDPWNNVVSIGDDGVSQGGRNAPTAAYAGFSPALHKDGAGNYIGGMFWDGRATGTDLTADLYDPLAEQAQGPFLNPVEMNMTVEAVVDVVRTSMYRDLFLQVFGSLSDTGVAFDNIARALAAFERSTHVQRFTSRYDSGQLTKQERNGLKLVTTYCTKCHAMETGANKGPLFTDYSYANIGVPVNPLLKDNPKDLGLGGFLASKDIPNADLENGKFKVPTLRNVALTAPYSHNGYFPTLKDIVNFKNTRDNGTWEAPEVSANRTDMIGSLGLSDAQVDAIVAFLMALTDSSPNM